MRGETSRAVPDSPATAPYTRTRSRGGAGMMGRTRRRGHRGSPNSSVPLGARQNGSPRARGRGARDGAWRRHRPLAWRDARQRPEEREDPAASALATGSRSTRIRRDGADPQAFDQGTVRFAVVVAADETMPVVGVPTVWVSVPFTSVLRVAWNAYIPTGMAGIA